MNKIAHCGTFDVDNYGDLLFPHIAEFRLPNYLWEHVSPTDNKTTFEDGKKIISFKNAKKNKYDAIVIGGGNIIHLLPNYRTVYKKNNGFEYANLWVGAAQIATRQKIPYIFNAPGISLYFKDYLHQKIAQKTFKNSSYLAFRESFSKEIADKLFDKKYDKGIVVPDTAFDVDRMWPLENFESSDYISVNLNQRYHEPIQETAFYLDKISSTLKMPIKFIIIGDCHGDYDFTIKISKQMKTEHSISNHSSLRKLASLIGNSKYFFGSSMHGFITALSYQVPALLVLNNNPMHKFKGLLEIAELNPKVICYSFRDSLKMLNAPAYLTDEVKIKLQKQLDRHWDNIDKIIKTGKKPSKSLIINKYEKLLKFNLNNSSNLITRLKKKLFT